MSSIDVIVPCYRYGHYLRECVKSVLAQDVTHLRVLVIDDASPDDTHAVADALTREDARVFLRRHAQNRGHIATYNEGIEWLEADYMLLLSADDYLLPGMLRRAMDLMDARPEVGFTFGDATALLEDGTLRPIVAWAGSGDDPGDYDVLGGEEFMHACADRGAANIVPTPTAIVRTALLSRVGGYDPALPHAGDLEMWLRLAAHASVGHLRGPQAVYRRHSDNMSLQYAHAFVLRDLLQRQAALQAFFDRCAYRMPDARLIHERLFNALALDCVGAASKAFNEGDAALSARIRRLACDLDPEVSWTSAWHRLTVKRLIGTAATRALRSLVARLRLGVPPQAADTLRAK